MSFVRSKEIPPRSGNWYDYEVETVHIGGKTIQKHIQYLGKKGGKHKPLIGGSGLRSRSMSDSRVNPSEIPVQPQSVVSCKHCRSHERVVKFGTEGGTQYYWCKDCKRKFANNRRRNQTRSRRSL